MKTHTVHEPLRRDIHPDWGKATKPVVPDKVRRSRNLLKPRDPLQHLAL